MGMRDGFQYDSTGVHNLVFFRTFPERVCTRGRQVLASFHFRPKFPTCYWSPLVSSPVSFGQRSDSTYWTSSWAQADTRSAGVLAQSGQGVHPPRSSLSRGHGSGPYRCCQEACVLRGVCREGNLVIGIEDECRICQRENRTMRDSLNSYRWERIRTISASARFSCMLLL